jgi:hypothetical protein
MRKTSIRRTEVNGNRLQDGQLEMSVQAVNVEHSSGDKRRGKGLPGTDASFLVVCEKERVNVSWSSETATRRTSGSISSQFYDLGT